VSYDVRKVADAVLYEGYVLYPYRASAQKNRSRWQFGVLMPPPYVATDPSERTMTQAECVFEYSGKTVVEIAVRFLQVQRRSTSAPAPATSAPVPGTSPTPATSALAPVTSAPAPATSAPVPGTSPTPPTWDEAVEQEVELAVESPGLLGEGCARVFVIPGGEEQETASDGAVVSRRRERLLGSVRVRATQLPGPWRAARLTVQVTNESGMVPGASTRDEALPSALVAVHMIITMSGGAFVSMTDPPEWAREEVARCENIGCWPVLAGPPDSRQVVLASPIILPDHPELASESPGDLYDGTEIDEILTLRTLALTDEEKAAARATDPRSAALIDRVDAMDAPTMAQLHGVIRTLRPAARDDHPAAGADTGESRVPWWDPEQDASVSPGTDAVTVAGHRVARGTMVRLRPGVRRADAQDMFLDGRTAVVEAVLFDVDETAYLAVSLADDPAADLRSAHGRFLYFAPDEVEPC
jgi:hypothetical protein